MKKATLFLLLLSLFAQIVSAQKIDIDKKSVLMPTFELPSKNVDTTFRTYSFNFKGEGHVGYWGLDLDPMKAEYFNLNGYQHIETGGDLHIEANLPNVRFLDSNVESRTEKSKDKAGRETSTTYYKHVLSYEAGFSWKMLDKNGKELTSKLMSLATTTNVNKYAGSEYSTYKEASESYHNNRAQIQRDIAQRHIVSSLSGMFSSMNSQFGYRETKDKFNIWVLDSKTHPEMQAFTSQFETVKAAFAAMAVTGATAADMEALKPAIEYYKAIPTKYKADEKADTKLRYAAYFNLANIYRMAGQPDKVTEYGNLIIANDYDKGDGKDFLKDAEKLREIMPKKKAAAHRFTRA